MSMTGCNKASITLQEICYYLFFSLLLWAKGFGLYDGQNIFKIFLILAAFCWFMKMCFTGYTAKELIIIVFMAILAAIIYWNTKEKGILFIFFIISGIKNIPVKRVFGVGLLSFLISFIPITILTTLGIVEGPFRVHVRPAVGFVIRWSLGQAHPNVGHISYFIFAVLIVYMLGEKINWKHILLLFAGNCFAFLYTVSQTGLLITTFYLLLIVYLDCRKSITKIEYAFVQCVLPMCILASLLAPLLLKGRAFEIVNKMMNTRLNLSRQFLTREKITLFGSKMQIADSITTMDNSYVFAFMTYGIVAFLFIMCGYFFVIKKYIKEKKNRELAIIISILLAGITEPFLFNTSFKNLSLLFLGKALFPMDGNGSIGIFHRWDMKWQIENKCVILWSRYKDIVQQHKKTIILSGLAIGICFAALYGITADVPRQIIVPRRVCDSTETASVYLERETALQDTKVLGYVDEKTEMIPFEGNLVIIEYVRGIVCRAVYGAALGMLIVFGICIMLKYNDSGSKNLKAGCK